jgi:hypothetical protein
VLRIFRLWSPEKYTLNHGKTHAKPMFLCFISCVLWSLLALWDGVTVHGVFQPMAVARYFPDSRTGRKSIPSWEVVKITCYCHMVV